MPPAEDPSRIQVKTVWHPQGSLIKSYRRHTKAIAKILHCLKYETQMGWLIDADERAVFVYFPKQQPAPLAPEDLRSIYLSQEHREDITGYQQPTVSTNVGAI